MGDLKTGKSYNLLISRLNKSFREGTERNFIRQAVIDDEFDINQFLEDATGIKLFNTPSEITQEHVEEPDLPCIKIHTVDSYSLIQPPQAPIYNLFDILYPERPAKTPKLDPPVSDYTPEITSEEVVYTEEPPTRKERNITKTLRKYGLVDEFIPELEDIQRVDTKFWLKTIPRVTNTNYIGKYLIIAVRVIERQEKLPVWMPEGSDTALRLLKNLARAVVKDVSLYDELDIVAVHINDKYVTLNQRRLIRNLV